MDRITRMFRRSLFASLAVVAALTTSLGARAESNVLFIFDASGSMKKKLESGETRIAVAKRAMSQALGDMPGDVRLGLLMYGHRKAKDCSDIELVSPIGADDAGAIAKRIQAAPAKGETPIAEALKQAVRSFAALKGQPNRIVLVTDGIEECGGDPCASAQAVRDAGLDLKVDIIGFTLTDKQRQTVQCVADTTGGKYYDAQDVKGLTSALADVHQQVVQATPPAPVQPAQPARFNLLSPKNGGAVLAAPNDVWLATADDSEQSATWMNTKQEGVYGFRDEKPATFDAFAVYIGGTDNGNPQELDLLAGDDGPTGQFRPIGTCKFQNVKLIKTPYQECMFAPVTARYLKVRLGQSFGGDGYVMATEFQLFGELGEGAAPTAAAPTAATSATRINLLSPKNGGAVLAAPNNVWLATADDSEQTATWMNTGQEGVYGFQDERPATFDSFGVFIGATDNGNPKEIELLAGDDGPLGQFRPIATCAAQNVKLTKTPYQECKFAPVTARYLKIRLGQSFGGDGYVMATEFQLFGELGATTAAAAPAAAAATSSSAINLLSTQNGGAILAAPNDVWLATVDDKEQAVTWMNTGQEGVYAFQGERPARFDSFAVYVGEAANGNPKEIELLAGDDGPGGQFREVATCSFQNVKLTKAPYQECKFASVTARYLKVRLGQSFGGDGYVMATEFRLMGQMTQ